MRLTFILLCLLFVGCDPNVVNKVLEPDTLGVKPSEITRYEIERVQIVYDDLAYEGRRGIYVIRDNETKREYLGVSGIGVTELGDHRVNKTNVSDER